MHIFFSPSVTNGCAAFARNRQSHRPRGILCTLFRKCASRNRERQDTLAPPCSVSPDSAKLWVVQGSDGLVGKGKRSPKIHRVLGVKRTFESHQMNEAQDLTFCKT